MKSSLKRKFKEEEITFSERGTFMLAKRLAERFKGNEVVLLIGELGAGKTVFAKGIAKGLGLRNTRTVCSPSYTILNIYKARYPVYHFDLYRLGKKTEIEDLGWEDYLGHGVVIVEWAEKIPFVIEGFRVTIEVGKKGERKIRIKY